MKYAFISDIHANLEALEACFKTIDAEGVDAIACLGDIVGYGASPNECVELVRERASHVVIGNHDAAVVGTTETEYFNLDARSAVLWTRNALTPENVTFLRGLPYTVAMDGLRLVHASPSAPEDWIYLFNARDAAPEFTAFEERLCFFGHTHFPGFFLEWQGKITQQPPPRATIRPGERAIINVGSVGQPRDGDPRAGFAVYDDQTGIVEIRRVFYDIGRVQSRILDTPLPKSAAERLVWGM
jgi:diadenosine tetraphosphatase ApaH/serine/threonine PP2A family protein phosphatase